MFTFVLEAYIDDLLVARSSSPGFLSSFDVCGDFPSKTSFPKIIKKISQYLVLMNLIGAFYPTKNFKVTIQ